MKKLFLSSFLLAVIVSANAQTVELKSSTPNQVSSGTSVHVGVSAGNSSSASSSTADNCFVGRNSGRLNVPNASSGNTNSFFGNNSGYYNTNGGSNLFSGYMSGFRNTIGSRNVYVGFQAGFNNVNGNNNVFIGYQAGNEETGSNKLYVANSGSSSPLVWGDFANSSLKLNGKVGIGGNSATGFGNFPTTSGGSSVSSYKLFVEGGILAEEVRVSLKSTWADYVFNKDYNLKTIDALEAFIAENGHLPNVPKATVVEADGINIAEMARIQMEKIEELTLYIIELNKKIEALESKLQTR